MIARVIPAVRLPYKASAAYDYSVPENLAPAVARGSVVVVPFAGRRVAGIVSEIKEKTQLNKPLKEIIGLAQGLENLPPHVLGLWEKLAGVFATTLPRWLWAALPLIPARAIQGAAAAGERSAENVPEQNVQPKFIFMNSAPGALEDVRKALTGIGEAQALILAPTVEEARSWAAALGGAEVFHSALAAGTKYGLFCAAASGRLRLVIGTKSSVFLPFRRLRLAVIIGAGSNGHAQEDQDPRFDARIVAKELARSCGARILSFDSLPPLGMTPEGSGGEWAFGNEAAMFSPQIHDLRDAAKAARARVLISEQLLEALDGAVAAGGRALLLFNRRGSAASYVCRDCGSVVNCPGCGLPLTVHHDKMTCPACERPYPTPEACGKCGGSDLKAVGFGSKSLFDLLKKRFPETGILHVDRDASFGGMSGAMNAAQIVVGTTAVFSSLPPDGAAFDLVADALAGAGQIRAGIWATETAARNLRTLASWVKPGGSLHVQTFDRTTPALMSLSDPAAFLSRELEERRAFGYPPAKTLITLYGSGKDEAALWREAADLTANLRAHMPRAICHEPTWSSPKLFRGKFRLTLALKVEHGVKYDHLVQYLPVNFAAKASEL